MLSFLFRYYLLAFLFWYAFIFVWSSENISAFILQKHIYKSGLKNNFFQ